MIMSKLLVDIDRKALERVRIKLGARSHAETLRQLIKEADPNKPTFAELAPTIDWSLRASEPDPIPTPRAMTKPLTYVDAPIGHTRTPYGSRLKKR